MKPRGLRNLEPRGNYRHLRTKRKGVYRFPRGSKSCRPRGFHRLRCLFILYNWQPIKPLSVLATETVSNRSVRKTLRRDGRVLLQLLLPSATLLTRALCLGLRSCDSKAESDSGIATIKSLSVLATETVSNRSVRKTFRRDGRVLLQLLLPSATLLTHASCLGLRSCDSKAESDSGIAPIKSLSVLATETVSNRSVRKTLCRDGRVLLQLLSPSATLLTRASCLGLRSCDSKAESDSGIAPIKSLSVLATETISN